MLIGTSTKPRFSILAAHSAMRAIVPGCAVAMPTRRLFSLSDQKIGDDDARALGDKALDNGRADSSRSARHDGDLVF